MLPLYLAAAALLSDAGPANPPQQCVTDGFMNNTNFPGNDIYLPGWPAKDLATCCDLCNADKQCYFYTFNPSAKCSSNETVRGCCHPKSSQGNPIDAPQRRSGRSTNRPPAPTPAPKGAKNVLFLIADDLRQNLAMAYDKPFMKTPNMDRLASRSLIFRRAYVQQQVCSPSRNSFMSGRRPDQTRTWNFIEDFRQVGANWSSMPGYFKNHGYQVYGTGKLYHPGKPVNNDGTNSWTAYEQGGAGRNMSCNRGKPVYSQTVNYTIRQGADWQYITDCEENDAEAELTQAAIDFLKLATNGSDTRPFWIGMGHHRPHLPWRSPTRFIDQYGDPSQYPIAKQQTYPKSAAPIQWHPWFDQVVKEDVEPIIAQQYLRRGYYGAVSYTDYHFGRMLDALDASGQANNTIVVLTGDHGWHLGERNMWEKKGLDEIDTRVPLLIAVPWIDGASKGKRTSSLAELVDLMPTLIDLAGLPPCEENLGGTSLVPVLKDPPETGTHPDFPYAYSQFPRCRCTYNTDKLVSRNGTCNQTYINQYTHEVNATGACNLHVCLFEEKNTFDWMGYSIRSDQFRYTIFVEWDKDKVQPNWESVEDEELYEHGDDDGTDYDNMQCSEVSNLANDPKYADVKAELKKALIEQFSNDFQ